MLHVAIEDPHQPDVEALLAESDAYSAALYPEEGRHAVDAGFLADERVRFFVARVGGSAKGCGALVLHGADWGEIKRLIVVRAARGRGVGRALLGAIEAAAAQAGVGCIRLETGPHSEAALGLYAQAGYRVRGPFGKYAASPHSVFMEKRLDGTNS
jgi:putative acetyltransferase